MLDCLVPTPETVFFDIEGAWFVDDGSLEYLFGLVTVGDGEPGFTAYWAHDRKAEKRAFENTVDFIAARLQAHPGAYVYHYGSYEETALKRLAMLHGTREAEVDDMLRRRKLVDLFKAVREAVRISEPSYSLKNIEVFYGSRRAGPVATALDSMVVYDRWQQTRDSALLDEIRAYNEADCRSLLACRDWLLSLRPAEVPWFGSDADTVIDVVSTDPDREARRKETEERNAAIFRTSTKRGGRQRVKLLLRGRLWHPLNAGLQSSADDHPLEHPVTAATGQLLRARPPRGQRFGVTFSPPMPAAFTYSSRYPSSGGMPASRCC